MAVKGIKPKEGTTGLVRHGMIYSKAAAPELHVPLDEPHGLAGGAGAVAEGFGEVPVIPKACELTKNKNHCDEVPCGRRVLVGGRLLLDDPGGGLRRRRRRDVCVTQEDSKTAWTEFRDRPAT